ncbi:hypothetical protein [Mucilaginibacter psychrotolerans]|uniref:Uncharacterized protein n=1 Tax=Mucilaginibacter psychrotolerans TaxID=1524096 RepID=A0A4Y8SAB9_9SPHI|nr:hypothetical protein [Mucilaginibacter psychrotolerans]TFF35497.1 hypothetical protein E2R66_18595 [Mucilaginibacter psychrotolerans]
MPPEIQALFSVTDDLLFSYGEDHEHYGEGFHKVPTTINLWVAGNETAAEVIISYSAMEAIAFIAVNRQRYPRPELLAFIAIGNRLHDEQIRWIRDRFRKSKFTLVFGSDMLGRVTDIKLAAGIKAIPLRVYFVGERLMFSTKGQYRIFDKDKQTLSLFFKAFGIRARIRTRKPVKFLTFLDQLKNENN